MARLDADYRLLVTEKDAARCLSLSHRTLQAWRTSQSGPPFIKIGRSVRYRKVDIVEWLESKRCALEPKCDG
ncbi:helix-turn-helix domain-containing protein [Bradyrhizobium sp. MOS003]|uniref:helix-turn-helix transcriptional regulator n=1 Tax=Bradyrhizobium sp. MOS003 TaxID=2133946 RepID=UPI000D13DB30|nr:helix-turn-helix domain-containing protein [Bradyrhizobium sp. MOS003]PSO19497.1 hypothetical protein C7G42_14680 [Bradyrhizobium sp. MOS003]